MPRYRVIYKHAPDRYHEDTIDADEVSIDERVDLIVLRKDGDTVAYLNLAEIAALIRAEDAQSYAYGAA